MTPAAAFFLAGVLACSQPPQEASSEPAPSPTPRPAEVQRLPDPVAPSRRAVTPFPLPAGPDLAKALEVLGRVVDTFAADPQNPWAIAHGLLARGEGFVLSDGAPALDALFSRYAFEQEVAGEGLIGFPRQVGDVRVEPHTDLILKNLTDIGVSPSREVSVGGKTYTVGDLWKHSLYTTWLDAGTGDSSFDSPNDMAWGMQGLAAWAQPGASWKANNGATMHLDDLARLMVHVLTSESSFLIQAMGARQPFEKKGQGIFRYTCGGAHLLQASHYVVARGFGSSTDAEKIQLQGRVLFYRFPIEIGIYGDLATRYPDKRLVLAAQQLKFVGHWLESAHRLAATGAIEVGPADQLVMARAADVLVDTVKDLKALGALDNLHELRGSNEQLYLDLVGDSAHALRGLELAMGRAAVLY